MRVLLKRMVDNGEALMLPKHEYDVSDEYGRRLVAMGAAVPAPPTVERGGTEAEAALLPTPETRRRKHA